MGRKGQSNADRRAAKEARREQWRGLRQNEDGAALRIGQFGGNWKPLPVSECATGLGLQIRFAGFWDRSANGKKVEGVDPNSGYRFVMDSTMAYYRVQNEDGHYVDAEGRTLGQSPYRGDQDLFNQSSHFANRRAAEDG